MLQLLCDVWHSLSTKVESGQYGGLTRKLEGPIPCPIQWPFVFDGEHDYGKRQQEKRLSLGDIWLRHWEIYVL